jgi:hypothetical protein
MKQYLKYTLLKVNKCVPDYFKIIKIKVIKFQSLGKLTLFTLNLRLCNFQNQ